MISMTNIFTPIEEALEAYKNGEFLIVMDDEDRENEGDLIMAAELITQEKNGIFSSLFFRLCLCSIK